MVFCVNCDNKDMNSDNTNPLRPGILDFHVTTGDDTPLLSLLAQSTLGLHVLHSALQQRDVEDAPVSNQGKQPFGSESDRWLPWLDAHSHPLRPYLCPLEYKNKRGTIKVEPVKAQSINWCWG